MFVDVAFVAFIFEAKRFVEVALVEVALMIERFAMLDDALAMRPAPKFCSALQVLALLKLSDATTAPVVGLTLSVPSLLLTEVTAPEPLPHALPVEERRPAASACTQVLPEPPSDETMSAVV